MTMAGGLKSFEGKKYIGWMKEEICNDLNIKDSDDPVKTLEDYIIYFNEGRPAYSLSYLISKHG